MMNFNTHLGTQFRQEDRQLSPFEAPKNYFLAALLMLMLVISSEMTAQESHLEFRFNNGLYNSSFNTYTIDVEVKSSLENSALYAMNLRFFYEADDLKLHSFTDFKKGYGLINKQMDSPIGAKNSAKKMFGLSGAAGYINQGLEMKSVAQADWKTNQWERVATIHFDVKSESFATTPCPSFMWDKQRDMDKGGLLKGSMGTTATFIGLNGEELECKSAFCNYDDFSWSMAANAAPYGFAQKDDCISLYNNEESESFPQIEVISLAQNTPNPFFDETSINVELPQREKVTFSIFDLKGVLLYNVTKDLDSGIHTISLNKEFNLPTGTLLYQIETDNYKSF